MGEQLTQVHTQQIMQAAFAKGHELELAPLTIVVLDAGGHMKAM